MINTPYTIGITGNIATGKSVIRQMLVNAGVFGIDADVLANRMIYPGGPAYQPVIDAFGPEIQSKDHSISHKKLGEIVFSDPDQLRLLESLTHPPVIQAILKRREIAQRPIVAIEAIKLLESGLDDCCDSIWVSHASFDHQVDRLMKTRGLSEREAITRIAAQPPQFEKLSRANIIINTETSFKDTWIRTQTALNDTIQLTNHAVNLHLNNSKDWLVKSINQIPALQVESAWEELAEEDPITLYTHLGMNTVSPILKNNHIQAFVIWEEWNFTGTLKKVFPSHFLNKEPDLVFEVFENWSRAHQTEILLAPDELTQVLNRKHSQHGFEPMQMDQITYPAWRIAAQKATSQDENAVWMKKLAQPFEMQANHFSTVK